jgi:copper resistance protein C
MHRTAPPLAVAAVITGLLASFTATPALAHAKLVSADPAPNATVASPRVVHLQFSEALAPRFSSFKLAATDGKPVPMRATQNQDAKVLEGMPNAALAPGVYTVSWTAVATDDGHKTTGSYRFTVK